MLCGRAARGRQAWVETAHAGEITALMAMCLAPSAEARGAD